jgi:hypothetical protein
MTVKRVKKMRKSWYTKPMINQALSLLKTKKLLLQGAGLVIVFMILYTMIDNLNLPMAQMAVMYGTGLVVLNVLTNLIMALGSAFMLNLSTAMAALKGKESAGSNLSYASILFGILTYGCTPCVIAFLASFGIAFSVIALPMAGYPYKIMSVVLIAIGIAWTLWEIEHSTCKIKPN